MSRTVKSKSVPDELAGYPLFEDFDEALAATKPNAVSINSWPNSHAEYAIKAMNADAHVFMEKPIATNNEDAERVVATARAKNRKPACSGTSCACTRAGRSLPNWRRRWVSHS